MINPNPPSCLYPSFKNTLYTIDNPTNAIKRSNNLSDINTMNEYSSFNGGNGVTSVINDANCFKNLLNDGNNERNSTNNTIKIITINSPKYFLSSTEVKIK